MSLFFKVEFCYKQRVRIRTGWFRGYTGEVHSVLHRMFYDEYMVSLDGLGYVKMEWVSSRNLEAV
jgi:hypothetical protein